MKKFSTIKSSFVLILPLILMLSGFIMPGGHCVHTSTYDSVDDGPYVIYKNNNVFVKYILINNGVKEIHIDSGLLDQKETLSLHVSTDEPGKTFLVRLKNKLQEEKSDHKKANKQMVISDIEGNFRFFRKLLQANGVIDTNYNWTFGEGNLILNGDFFDRGSQVTEVLWLIYSLEDKAKAAGGYVHFILGNHEIMNMSGDLRYVQSKYIDNAELLGERYVELYGDKSELGRWLRTKNVIEKVGNMLYVHGGISQQINQMDISISKINELARPFYADSSSQFENNKQETLYSNAGPFWYRGYYQASNKARSEQIDSTILKFNIRHIATGHTIVGDTISVWYGGRVLNTDVHHASGISEALLIEDGKFYRVNTIGEKFLMMN